ncbi:flagellar protein FlaG [Halobacillus salinarum]|uniref:Flagellar protein FlaG n=1 Tax=Halobacillus salinarum TaxID=2932257 RepID=A0ABY4EP67_9BACI|nr:flagellar protein FlaG [Halobacillus salinarum]UOQ45732.1 flagellar protein FlaG [Halobacillus salinarum]
MNVGPILTQSQLLQKNSSQPRLRTSVQEPETEAEIQSAVKNEQEQQAPTKEDVKKVVDGLNRFLEPVKTSIRFQYHEKLEEYYVTIVDNKTDKVIKEIPPKKMLDLYAAMAESLGIIVDHKI